MGPRLVIPNCPIPRLVSGVDFLATERHVAPAVVERLVRVHCRASVSAVMNCTESRYSKICFHATWPFIDGYGRQALELIRYRLGRPCPAPTLARAAALPSSAASRSSPRPPPTSTCPTGTGPTLARQARTRRRDSSRRPALHYCIALRMTAVNIHPIETISDEKPNYD